MAYDSSWSYKDISSFYDRVRMALGAVSAQTIPDEYMDFPEKAPMAQRIISARVPSWMELDEQKFAVFESAIIYKTASLFQSVVSNNRIIKKSLPTITLQYSDSINFDTDGMGLSDLVELLIAELNGTEYDVGSEYNGFRVTGSKRPFKRCRRC